MKSLTIVLFVTLLVTVYAARIPRDDKAASDALGGEAETRSKITDFTKQISGTFTRYFNDGKQTIETQLKNLRRTGSEQFNRASQTITKAVDNVRSSLTGSNKSKVPEAPKIENPVSVLGN